MEKKCSGLQYQLSRLFEMIRKGWRYRKVTEGGTVAMTSPKLTQAIDAKQWPPGAAGNVMTQDEKIISRYDYQKGPMYFLGQQIVRQMQKAGYPSKIVYCYRSPEKQNELYAKGRTAPGRRVTNAKAFRSAHQYSEAVDICHKHRGWDVPEAYWEQLAIAVRIIEERYGVPLNHGHTWRFRDSAHIEVMAWKEVKHMVGERVPTQGELDARFADLLPKPWRAYTKSRAYEKRLVAGLEDDPAQRAKDMLRRIDVKAYLRERRDRKKRSRAERVTASDRMDPRR